MSKLTKRVTYRRKRNGQTNYKKRLKLLLSRRPRLVIRRSTNNITLQLVSYDEAGDKIIVSAHSSELKKIGWKMNTGNIPAAYLTGIMLAKKAKDKKVGEVVVDIGLNTPSKGSRIFAALKGAVDNGLNTPHTEDRFPDDMAIKGQKIKDYFDSIKEAGKQFAKYKENKIDVLKQFEEIKNKLMK